MRRIDEQYLKRPFYGSPRMTWWLNEQGYGVNRKRVARLMGVNLARGQVIRSLALSYAATLVYVVVGLLFNVFLRWNTAVAFGATGVLWALGPMIAAFRSMMDGKLEGAILLATVCGGLTLLGWVVLAAV